MKTKNVLCMLLAALLAALCALPALAAVPNPPDEFYYLDQANVLSEATKGEIFFSNQLLNDACGAQIVVVTVKSTKPDSIDDFSYKLINQWGIGDKDKQNGFLLVLAIDDDNYYAVPGTGLESKLTAGTLNQYFDDYLENDFAAQRYDAGAKRFFEAVFKRVADVYNAKVTTAQGIAAYQDWSKSAEPAPMKARSGGARMSSGQGSSEGGDSNSMIAIVTIILIIVVALALSGRRRRTYYGGGWFPFFVGSAMRRRTPPPPPPPGGPTPGPGGYRGAPGGGFRATSGGSGLSGLFRSSGGGAGRSSGGSGRSSFGGGSRSFGSARGGGGGSRGGGAGRGRH